MGREEKAPGPVVPGASLFSPHTLPLFLSSLPAPGRTAPPSPKSSFPQQQQHETDRRAVVQRVPPLVHALISAFNPETRAD